jgi:lipopolysaccharide transport system ATP-binding protein
MSNIAIKFENISKQYRLGLVSTRTLSHDLKRWWTVSIRGKEDPYLQIGETNDRSKKGVSEYIWALRNIDFEVKKGEVIGIIGKNGAGKSTLLKILSRVTSPTTGSIKAYGRMASLLEVGTGFHGELTGRENIFMNGAIMGMTIAEIKSKFDEIVDFAGVERYIETPVKRYSSGMLVRLGFAVAAHLEPEILVVDEVLAVGDAEFQKKAIGKMQDVSSKEGRTVLFVSHNMQSIKSICQTALILKQGSIARYGNTKAIVEHYLQENSTMQSEFIVPSNKYNNFAYAERILILNKNGEPCNKIPLFEAFSIKVFITVKEKIPYFITGIGISTFDDIALNTTHSSPMDIEPGKYEYTFKEEIKFYTTGKYKIYVGLSSRENNIQFLDDLVSVEFDDEFSKEELLSNKVGYLLNQMNVEIKKIV